MGDKEPRQLSEFDTLVQYSTPVLVVRQEAKPRRTTEWDTQVPNLGGATMDGRTLTEKILNSILPPRCWEEDGQMWQQTLSTTPSLRQDVLNLQAALDTRLEQCQARETGVCPIRRKLYAQCLDEIVRQETISTAERGLLLLRIRNEINMSIHTYENLFSSSVAYGMRKALLAHEEKETLNERIKLLEEEMEVHEAKIKELEVTLEQTEQRNAVMLEKEEQKFVAEALALQKLNDQVKAQLDGIASTTK